MKKILKYPFLCLLVLTMLAAAPFIWKQIGLLPKSPAQEQPEDPTLSLPEIPETPQSPESQEDLPPPSQDIFPPVTPNLPETPAEPQVPGDPDAKHEPKDPVLPEKPENPFEGALFIGDSRTVGISEYSGITEADFFASVGMSVYTMFKETHDVGDLKNCSLETLLGQKQYQRIYLMLGINELGYNFQKTVDTFAAAVDTLRQLQPDAVVILQANLHVTKKRSDSDTLYNNGNINRLNEAIAALADEEHVYFIDVNPVFDDENGSLSADYTWDAVHILGKYYVTWADWLRENTPA